MESSSSSPSEPSIAPDHHPEFARDPMDVHSTLPDLRLEGYARMIAPIVLVKRGFEVLYQLFTSLLWANINQDPIRTDEQLTAIAFLSFCVLSLFAYSFRDYTHPVLLAVAVIAWLDRQLALSHYHSSRSLTQLRIRTSDQQVIWQQTPASGRSDRTEFDQTQIQAVELRLVDLHGGAFHHRLDRVWQVRLIRCDRVVFLLRQSPQVWLAWKTATQLAARWQVPLVVANSTEVAPESEAMDEPGRCRIGQYAATQFAPSTLDPTQLPRTIQCRRTAQHWHIFSLWQWQNTGIWLGQTLKECGLLIFVAVLFDVMTIAGGLLQTLITVIWGNSTSIDWGATLAIITPTWTIWTTAELISLVLWLVIQGAQLSQEEHIWVDRHHLQFHRNQRPIAQLDTSQIQAVFLVQMPVLRVVVIGSEGGLQIDGLQRAIEYQAMLLGVDRAIREMQTDGQSTRT